MLENVWIRIKQGFLFLALGVITFLELMWKPFILGADLAIAAINKLTGKHIASVSSMVGTLKDGIKDQIKEYSEEVKEHTRLQKEKELAAKSSEEKKTAHTKVESAKRKKLTKEEIEAAKQAELERIKKIEEQETKARNKAMELAQKQAEARKALAMNYLNTVNGVLQDEVITSKKVILAILKMWVDMMAQKLALQAAAAFASGNILQGIGYGAASALVSAGGNQFIHAIEKGKIKFNAFAAGGIISEPVAGIGQNTGAGYLIGEAGPEEVRPLGKGGGNAGVVVHTLNVYTNDPRDLLNKLQGLGKRMNVSALRA